MKWQGGFLGFLSKYARPTSTLFRKLKKKEGVV